MILFLLFALPVALFLIRWHFMPKVHFDTPLQKYTASAAWGFSGILITLPFRGFSVFTGDYVFNFLGVFFVDGLLGPGILFVLLTLRTWKQSNQGQTLLRTTIWLASYFILLSLADVFTARGSDGIPELFVIPLLRVILLAWLPILYLRYTLARKSDQLKWILKAVAFGAAYSLLLIISYSPWALVSWVVIALSLVYSYFYLDKFYKPSQI